MSHSPFNLGYALPATLVAAIAIALGCVSGDSLVDKPLPTSTVDTTDLGAKLDVVLDSTYQDRELSIERNAAWQVLHGMLAYGNEFQVTKDGQPQSAVNYLLGGGELNGWTLQPGREFDGGRRGLVSVMEPGAKEGQGHQDQWAAILAQCDLSLDQTIKLDSQEFNMADLIEQVKWDVARNPYKEYSWTLIALTRYVKTDAQWQAADGKTWKIDDLVRVELDQELSDSACGGTHRLIGLTMALNQHLATGGELTGVWKEAREKIDAAIAVAQANQNPDGSFSNDYFDGPGQAIDVAENIGASGHTLEFLSLAMTDEQLQQPWMKRAVSHLCDVLETTRNAPLECGALYHAVHGLVLYRERVYGPRNYGVAKATVLTQSTGL